MLSGLKVDVIGRPRSSRYKFIEKKKYVQVLQSVLTSSNGKLNFIMDKEIMI